MMNKLRLFGLVFVLAVVALDPVPGPAASIADLQLAAAPHSPVPRLHEPAPLKRRVGPVNRYGWLIGRAGGDPERFWNYIHRASRLEPQLFEGEGKKKRSPHQNGFDSR